MEPYYFGSNAQLFGAFHSPTGAINNKGVLIAPPLFSDYMRSHRVLRQVALRLSERGFAVLRFDLRGTGNSLGDMVRLTRRDWVEDVSLAIDELREIGTIDRMAVMGVRHGSTLVAEAIGNNTVDEAVFWDPPLPDQKLFEPALLSPPSNGESGLEFQGFVVGKSLVDGWDQTTIDAKARTKRTLVLTSGQSRTSEDQIRMADVDCAWEKGRLDELIYSRDLVDSLCNAF